MTVESIVGDGAYSEKELIEFANDNNIHLVSKLSKTVTVGNRKNQLDKDFYYNKDAQMYVCPAGHMASKKSCTGVKSPDKPQRETYFFDVDQCRKCPLKDKCGFKDCQKSKTYNATVRMSQLHYDHLEKQESDEYRSKEWGTKKRTWLWSYGVYWPTWNDTPGRCVSVCRELKTNSCAQKKIMARITRQYELVFASLIQKTRGIFEIDQYSPGFFLRCVF